MPDDGLTPIAHRLRNSQTTNFPDLREIADEVEALERRLAIADENVRRLRYQVEIRDEEIVALNGAAS